MSDTDHPRPRRADVRDLLDAHLAEHRAAEESFRLRDLHAEESLVRDYAGRVVYELIQNALDRARESIVVVHAADGGGGGTLIVGNDGRGVSAYPRPTIPPVGGPPHSDFHALLSTHSSSKSARGSVGNKGVGFRSVFSVTGYAQIWSRADDDSWWGLGLSHPAAHGHPNPRWSQVQVASFYDPAALSAPTDTDLAGVLGGILDAEALRALVTVVVLPGMRVEAVRDVKASMSQLADLATPLVFLSERGPGITLRFRDDAGLWKRRVIDEELGRVAEARATVRVDDATRKVTGLDLELATVRVALPAVSSNEATTWLWSYLPTEDSGGFGAHIHADFYLSNSRKNVALPRMQSWEAAPVNGGDPPAWNARLMVEAARLIVDELWTRPDVLGRLDFWQLCTPEASVPGLLRWAVTRRFLADGGQRLLAVVKGAFAQPPEGGWPIRRYTEFFGALEAWADAAYRVGVLRGKLGENRTNLRDLVRQSGAAVIPVVGEVSSEDQLVPLARPIPPFGGAADRDTIYYRESGGKDLPSAAARSRTYVTAFEPPHMGADPAWFGMVRFLRTEVLARLEPVETDDDRRALLVAALRLANERQASGGRDSVIERSASDGVYAGSGPAWRLRPPARKVADQDPLERAGLALARLHVPTLDGGWTAAGQTTDPVDAALAPEWPWPRLDTSRFASIAAEAGVEPSSAARLLGVSAGPPLARDSTGAVVMPDWDRITVDAGALASAARGILAGWDGHLGAFLMGAGADADPLRHVLHDASWIPADSHALGGPIRLPDAMAGLAFVRPSSLWLQRADGKGFQTKLLPTVLVEDADAPSPVAAALGLRAVPARPIAAAMRLTQALGLVAGFGDPAPEHARDLAQLYVRLVRALPEEVDAGALPVLVRRWGSTSNALGWRRSAPDATLEEVWFDPGDQAAALAAFEEHNLWVVRGEKKLLASAIGLQEFAPLAKVRCEGTPEQDRTDVLRSRLVLALPDMLAAAHAASARKTADLDEERVLRTWTHLRTDLRHHREVWVDLDFRGRSGRLGFGDGGDALVTQDSETGRLTLVFDGDIPPMESAAEALAEPLCGHRAFREEFRDAAKAWSRAGWPASDEPTPPSVVRFRRAAGVAVDDVKRWRDRVRALDRTKEEMDRWRAVVVAALGEFGDVREEYVVLGTPISPTFWAALRQPGADSAEVARAIRARLADEGAALAGLAPDVTFRTHHERALDAVQRARGGRWPEEPAWWQLGALALLDEPPARWKEELREELHTLLLAAVSPEEGAVLDRLGCDVRVVLCSRIGTKWRVPADDEQWAHATAWMRGELRVQALPSPASGNGELQPWTDAGSSGVMAPPEPKVLDDRNRRKAARGDQAEHGLMKLVMAGAREWWEADETSLRRALLQAVAWDAQATREMTARLAKVASADQLVGVLRVAGWYMNAGFDLLRPDAQSRTVSLVEVKRVGSLEDAAFFLSENERRRALELRAGGWDWRLWLVATDGRTEDVTWVADRFAVDPPRSAIGTLLTQGIRPGEYLLCRPRPPVAAGQ